MMPLTEDNYLFTRHLAYSKGTSCDNYNVTGHSLETDNIRLGAVFELLAALAPIAVGSSWSN